jgi:hypothetical protein
MVSNLEICINLTLSIPNLFWLKVKKARAQSAKPKERAHVDGEAAVGSEFPVFAWWTVDPKTMEAGSDILLTSIELTRYSQSLKIDQFFTIAKYLTVRLEPTFED